MNLHEKLVEVRKSIDSFIKDTDGYGYKYVSGSQILEKIKKKMDELGILLEQHLLYPAINQSAKGYLITSQMKMTWVNAEKPDDKIDVNWFCTGEQKDPSQAFGSALTYSERYFLLKFFGAPTDEDDPDKLLKDKIKDEVKPKKEIDPDIKLKKELIKKHKGNVELAKAEYEEIKQKEKQIEKEVEEVEAPIEYLEEKFGIQEEMLDEHK
jgi:hypothetical protein